MVVPERNEADGSVLRVVAAAPSTELTAMDEMLALARRTIAASVADETEVVWIEYRSGEEGRRPPERRERHGPGSMRPAAPSPLSATRREVLVRVADRGRIGFHRTLDTTWFGLELATRCALAQSRAQAPLQGLPHLPNDSHPTVEREIADPAIAALWNDPEAALALLRSVRTGDATGARLRFVEGRVAVLNSRGASRFAAPTAATLELSHGRTSFGEGGGAAAASARTLAGLPVDELLAAATARSVPEAADFESESTNGPVALGPEAVAQLVDAMGRALFSAEAYRTGSSLLRDHRGVQVFDRSFSVRDDALDPAGLPFPFDLEGTAKSSIELVREGTPRTPTLGQRHAALLGLAATGHSSGGDDAQPENLFVAPGTASDDDLLQAADGGVWIGRLGNIECLDGRPLQIRARARQVRTIRQGRLGQHLPDLIWTFHPMLAFARILAVGSSCRTLASGPVPGLLGASRAPGMVLTERGALRPAA
jgi:predicted Zn-dependent protease